MAWPLCWYGEPFAVVDESLLGVPTLVLPSPPLPELPLAAIAGAAKPSARDTEAAIIRYRFIRYDSARPVAPLQPDSESTTGLNAGSYAPAYDVVTHRWA